MTKRRIRNFFRGPQGFTGEAGKPGQDGSPGMITGEAVKVLQDAAVHVAMADLRAKLAVMPLNLPADTKRQYRNGYEDGIEAVIALMDGDQND